MGEQGSDWNDGGVNLYGFVRNAPCQGIDLFGRMGFFPRRKPECCCCDVDDIEFKYLGRGWDATSWWGHWRGRAWYKFNFNVNVSYREGKGGDCKLEYLEKSSTSDYYNGAWTDWNDSMKSKPESPTFSDWLLRSVPTKPPCKPSSDIAVLDDKPSMGLVEWNLSRTKPENWRSATKKLRIKVVVRSGCDNTKKILRVKMKTVIENGVPSWEKSEIPTTY